MVPSWLLSQTALRGEASSFHLELPPYRPPRFLQTLYTSLIDRTIYVVWRAIVFALPAGVNLMLFSLLHNPCLVIIYTIYKDTGSWKWTTVANLMPVAMGVAVCFVVAQVWYLVG